MYNKDDKQNVIILSTTGIMMLFMAIPIADAWHIILASMILYIEVIYILHLNDIKLESSKALFVIDVYLILFIIFNISYNAFNIKNETVEFNSNKESGFYLTFIKNPQRIKNVEEFVKLQNGKVLIVSPEAGIYNIDLNLESHNFFDMPFNGNLGSNQLKKMIQGLEKYEDYYILIHTNKKYNQEIDEFRNHIIENYNEISKIEDFTVYKK